MRLYVEVRELSNYWIEIRKWGVILEQVYFHEEIVPTMVLRLARKLGIPPELFWDPAAVDRYDR
ncbi:MAG TPA: hypothetical protein VN181_08200 [Thermoanaerobaculia bacterium]|nr:hypothetical protein [Thermoanaerobaculia bacterium]